MSEGDRDGDVLYESLSRATITMKEEKMERKKITPVDIQAMKKEGKNIPRVAMNAPKRLATL